MKKYQFMEKCTNISLNCNNGQFKICLLSVFFSLINIHTKISITILYFFWCLSGDSVLRPSVHVETVGRWQNQDVGEWTSQAYHRWRRAKGSKEFAHQLLHSQHPQTHSLCLQVHLLRGSQFRQRHRADLLNWFVSWKGSRTYQYVRKILSLV